MDEKEKQHVKNELRQVLQLNGQIQFENLSEVQTIYDRVSSDDYKLTTPFGQRYVEELGKLLQNTGEKPKCAICQKDTDNPTLICNRCMEKYIRKKEGDKPAKEPEKKPDAVVEEMRAQTLQSANSDVAKIKSLAISDVAQDMKELSERYRRKYKEALVFILLYVAMGIVYYLRPNNGFLPMLTSFGSAVLSVLMMLYFYEAEPLHRFRVGSVLLYLFLGSGAYTGMALLLPPRPGSEIGNAEAFLYGASAELVKLLVLAFVLLLQRRRLLILEGAFLGAAVGAGFAVSEAVGYIFGRMVSTGYDDLLNAIFHRVVFLSGSEIAWSAYAGAALVWACRKKPFRGYQLVSPGFLLYFSLPLAMHALWDMPFGRFNIGPFLVKQVLLFVLVMVMLREFIRRGMAEYRMVLQKKKSFRS